MNTSFFLPVFLLYLVSVYIHRYGLGDVRPTSAQFLFLFEDFSIFFFFFAPFGLLDQEVLVINCLIVGSYEDFQMKVGIDCITRNVAVVSIKERC